MTVRNLIFALVLTLFIGASVGAPATVSVTGELLIKTA